MTLGPLINEIQEKLRQNNSTDKLSKHYHRWHFNDFESWKYDWSLKYIDENGKKSGYKINFDKTQYIVFKVTNKEELLRKIHILKEIGLKDEKIKIHQDSVSFMRFVVVLREWNN